MLRRVLPACLLGVAVLCVALLGLSGLNLGPGCVSQCGERGATIDQQDLDLAGSPPCLRADACGGGAANASSSHLQVAPAATTVYVLAALSLVLGFVAFRRNTTSLDLYGRLFRPPRIAG